MGIIFHGKLWKKENVGRREDTYIIRSDGMRRKANAVRVPYEFQSVKLKFQGLEREFQGVELAFQSMEFVRNCSLLIFRCLQNQEVNGKFLGKYR